jgi:Asp/Glu/hydantoin racemase
MIDATIDMLRARHNEHVAYVGVVGALFCDDLPKALTRLENCRDAAKAYARTLDHRKQREARRLAGMVASAADDLIPGIRQLVERAQ